jgi:hypothetical protein
VVRVKWPAVVEIAAEHAARELDEIGVPPTLACCTTCS